MTPRRSKPGKRALCDGILGASLVLMAVLAIPVALFTLPIVAVWSVTDRLLRRLE